jgi:hypothetical protein
MRSSCAVSAASPYVAASFLIEISKQTVALRERHSVLQPKVAGGYLGSAFHPESNHNVVAPRPHPRAATPLE